MDFILFKEDSKDWGYIWDELRKHPINENLEEPCIAMNNGQVWQYMGSFKNGNIVISDFRHIEHPYDNTIQKVVIKHELIDKESIGDSRRIK